MLRPAALVLCVTASVAAAMMTVAPPAYAVRAHPFGPPQTVDVAADGKTVTVRWRFGAVDDLLRTGIALGILSDDFVMPGSTIEPDPRIPQAVAESPRFADYLLSRITVTQDGTDCAGTVGTTRGLETEGIPIRYACPGRLDAVEVSVRMLTDLDSRYVTLGSGPGGQRVVYDADHISHVWSLGADTAGAVDDRGRGSLVQIGAILGITVVLGSGVLWGMRRRRPTESAA